MEWAIFNLCEYVLCDVVCVMQEEFFNCLCSVIDHSSDSEDDSLADAAERVVLNGQSHLAVVDI